jgi:class 3 adenylate cyclase/uncharacterized protein (DUF427 family)
VDEDSRYRFSLEPCPHRIRAEFAGVVIADSTRALILRETRLPPVYYFPATDVRRDLLRKTAHRTHCPLRGNASYWTLSVNGRKAENAVWSYEHPLDDAMTIQGMLAFDWSRMDAWYEDERRVFEPAPDATPYSSNPFTNWILSEAWQAQSSRELVGRLSGFMRDLGMPLWRLKLLIRTLHPQLFATSYTWLAADPRVARERIAHAVLQSPEYLASPFAAILDGAGGVRRRLEGAGTRLDFPILEDLHAQGCTDYVAMPMPFSDGQINIITLVSDVPGGFPSADLGHLYEILPALSRLFEVHALRRTAITLLDTYLGRHSGERVLEGRIRRGDSEELNAILWFCDLRDSTALTEAMAREAYLDLLNRFLDAMAGAVLEHDGEVLKYIGDAVLAMFPLGREAATQASRRAVAAARMALRRLDEINRERAAARQPALRFGIAMHPGSFMYGNIGTTGRLDFTAIGAAVNETSRIEGLSKTLGVPVLLSAEFARLYPGELVSLGEHALRGVRKPRELFTLPGPAGGVVR